MALKSNPVTLGVADTIIYQAPVDAGAVVQPYVSNVHATLTRTYTLKLFKQSTGLTTTLGAPSAPLAALAPLAKIPLAVSLEPGDRLIGLASAASSIVITPFIDISRSSVAKGFNPRGVYAAGTTYAENDVAYLAATGASYISIQDVNVGNSPDVSPAWWMVSAAQGAPGSAGVAGASALQVVRVLSAGAASPTADFASGDIIDGVTLVANDLVLRASASSPELNGVYVASASGAAIRHTEYNTYDEHPGRVVSVTSGTVYADTMWQCTSNPGGVLGTNPLTFANILGAAVVMSDGSGAVSRSVQSKLADNNVNALDFGVDMTGATDSVATMTAALAQAKLTTGVLYVPPGIVRLDSTLVIPVGVSLIGAGMPAAPHLQASYPSLTTEVNGTWFFLNHSGYGLWIKGEHTGNDQDPARSLRKFGTYRTQPAPTGGAYTPTDHTWDIIIISTNDVHLSEIMLLNASRGILVTGDPLLLRGSTRIDMSRIFGQPLKVGIHMEYVYDVCRISEIHFWAFWCAEDAGILAYTLGNSVALQFGRVDNPQIDRVFCLMYKIGILIFHNTSPHANLPAGTIGNAQIGLMQFDATQTAVWVVAGADVATLTFDQLVCYGGGASPYSNEPRAFNIAADTCDIRIIDLKTHASGSQVGTITGTGTHVRISQLTTSSTDTNATGLAQFSVSSGNHLHIAGDPNLDAAENKLVGGAGVATGNFWRHFTPVITPQSGSGLVTVAAARYQHIGDTIDLHFAFSVTANGTGAGAVQMTLPYASHPEAGVGFYAAGVARDLLSGKMCQVTILAGSVITASLHAYDGTYPIVTGAQVGGSLTYRCTP